MKKILVVLGLIVFISSCNLFENKEKKAIEVCQKAKVQINTDNAYTNLILNASGLGTDATWLDYANYIAKQDPNKKYGWSAQKTEDEKYYLVSFVDTSGWGQHWEVEVDQQIVKFIDQSPYLTRKYGISRFDPDNNFQITNITIDTIKLEKQYNYSGEQTNNIVYILKASIENKTGKPLTEAEISGKLQVIFKDKTVEGDNDYDSGLKTIISKSKPWDNNTEKNFYIKTKGIEEIYLNYEPEYVFFDVNLKAADPVGFTFNKAIAEYDLKGKWKTLKH